MEPQKGTHHRFGFVAVVGRPNVGKSTLVNRIIGSDLSIVTSKAQTTRHLITAIHTLPQAQIVFLDTPGFHNPKTLLNRSMVAAAHRAMEQADLILFVTTPEPEIHSDDVRMLPIIQSSKARSLLAINKMDLVQKSRLAQVEDKYSRLHRFDDILYLSAIQGAGLDKLLKTLIRLIPLGPALFPEDDISDLPLRFFAAEIIREQIITMTGQEVPYKTTVMVETFREEADRVVIQADIHVERESQKRIMIGKGGSRIKQIGIAARSKLEELVETKIRLELFVKVTPRWTTDPARLKELGY